MDAEVPSPVHAQSTCRQEQLRVQKRPFREPGMSADGIDCLTRWSLRMRCNAKQRGCKADTRTKRCSEFTAELCECQRIWRKFRCNINTIRHLELRHR